MKGREEVGDGGRREEMEGGGRRWRDERNLKIAAVLLKTLRRATTRKKYQNKVFPNSSIWVKWPYLSPYMVRYPLRTNHKDLPCFI